MSSQVTLGETTIRMALRQAALRAARAPSVHNTQPWQFVLGGKTMEIYADRRRQLDVLDPRRRQLMVSCGCALLNARVSLAKAGLPTVVERFPDSTNPDLVARITVDEDHGEQPDLYLARLDEYIEERRTNRRPFFEEGVPFDIVDLFADAARREGAEVFIIERPEHRLATAHLTHRADEIENGDPAYRAELRAWTSDDPRREDGVLAFSVPHVEGTPEESEVPIRDFDTHGNGWLPGQSRSSLNQCMLLLGAYEDGPIAWVRGGEALDRMLLEVTRAGYAASPLTQVIEVALTNNLLRLELGLAMHPHVLVRIGRAPTTTATRRRRLAEVITEADPG